MKINLFCTHRAPRDLDFPHELQSRRDASDPDLLQELDHLIAILTGHGQRDMTHRLYHVCRHIERVNHHICIEVEESQLESVARWASDANAIFGLSDGLLRSPTGGVLLDGDGNSDEDAQLPYPDDAVARKARHEEWLAQQGGPVNPMLPPVVGRDELQLRESGEVARRALALLLSARRAESIATGNEISLSSLRSRLPRAYESLTLKEIEFLADEKPEQRTVVNFRYAYECAYVLQWALGLCDEMTFPGSICNVAEVVRRFLQHDESTIIEAAMLRPTDEILDELDMHYRFLWIAREVQLGRSDFRTDLDPGVLQERCVTLNWLTSFQRAEWDDVDCPA